MILKILGPLKWTDGNQPPKLLQVGEVLFVPDRKGQEILEQAPQYVRPVSKSKMPSYWETGWELIIQKTHFYSNVSKVKQARLGKLLKEADKAFERGNFENFQEAVKKIDNL